MDLALHENTPGIEQDGGVLW